MHYLGVKTGFLFVYQVAVNRIIQCFLTAKQISNFWKWLFFKISKHLRSHLCSFRILYYFPGNPIVSLLNKFPFRFVCVLSTITFCFDLTARLAPGLHFARFWATRTCALDGKNMADKKRFRIYHLLVSYVDSIKPIKPITKSHILLCLRACQMTEHSSLSSFL